MNIGAGIKGRATRQARRLVYSRPVRNAVRKVMEVPAGAPVQRYVKGKGLEDRFRRLTSEALPEGMYFAKLTIHGWEKYVGTHFQLLQGGEVVYGNEIERPPGAFPLEYRNIIVTSDNLTDYSLNVGADFTLQIGRGAFTTPQQLKYDRDYGVEQHGDVYYSLRGNITNPSKMVVTFPGFGPSTTRISYAVSYLKAITDDDLADTVMICFQDRYLAAGSYMLVDNGWRSLRARVHSVIKDHMDKFSIEPDQLLLFGASKGGSIAVVYAEAFPSARLILCVPQMVLPYYFNKPFFRDNLLRVAERLELPEPAALLRKYFLEGRRIEYFYTNSDELSNHSLIEFVEDVPNLTKYRVNGNHSEVARRTLPTVLGLIREFLHGEEFSDVTCEDSRSFWNDGHMAAQVRLDTRAALPVKANWYLVGNLGRTKFMQLVTDHSYGFVKYTNDAQRLDLRLDRAEQLESVVGVTAEGRRVGGALPSSFASGSQAGERLELDCSPLDVVSPGVREHAVLHGEELGRFKYRVFVPGPSSALDVMLVDDINATPEAHPSLLESRAGRCQIAVQSLDDGCFLEKFVVRLAIGAQVGDLRVLNVSSDLSHGTVSRLGNADWRGIEIVVDSGWMARLEEDEAVVMAGLLANGSLMVHD